jgi:hypothetical protein
MTKFTNLKNSTQCDVYLFASNTKFPQFKPTELLSVYPGSDRCPFSLGGCFESRLNNTISPRAKQCTGAPTNNNIQEYKCKWSIKLNVYLL